MINPWAIFSFIVAIFAIFVTIIIQFNSSIDKKIEIKLQDPIFIKKVASNARLPLLIFDEEKKFLADTGASELIRDIKIVKDGRDVKEIIITPKRFFPVAPILESIDGYIEFDEPQHGSQFDWV
jgi:hypothetical protein